MVNFASAYTHVYENHETLCHIVHDPKTMRKTKTGWLTVNVQGKEINEPNHQKHFIETGTHYTKI